MAKTTNIVLVLACIILICDSTNLEDILIKCHVTDDVCHKKLYGEVIPAVQSGVIHIDGVEPIDPHRMNNITASVLGMVDFTLIIGIVTGMKNCEITDFRTFIERHYATMHITCNIKIEGTFGVSSSSPVINKLFGDSINSEGDGTLIFDGLNMVFEFHYNAKKGEDGENHLILRTKETTHKYVYSGKTELITDNLIPNNQDANDFIVNFLEENSSFIKASIGSAYVAQIVKFYYNFCDKFFRTVPAKKYVLDDLTPFINN